MCFTHYWAETVLLVLCATCDIEMTVCGIHWLCCTVAHPLRERGGPGEASKGRASSWPEGWPTDGRSFPAATLMVLTENGAPRGHTGRQPLTSFLSELPAATPPQKGGTEVSNRTPFSVSHAPGTPCKDSVYRNINGLLVFT